jgi:hypothetical protein
MAAKGLTIAGIIASLAVIGLTLAVFSLSQLRGPEGSVHRYLLAVGEKNGEEVNRLSFGTQRDKVVVANFVSQVFQYGAQYQIVDVSQRAHLARVGVLFRFRDGTELPWIVSVRRVGRNWLIDAAQSTNPGPAFLN